MYTLSCGHKVESLNDCHDILLKSQDKEGNKEVCHASICKECQEWHRKLGSLFEDTDTAWEWLHGKQQQ
jgi:hypothetical protein